MPELKIDNTIKWVIVALFIMPFIVAVILAIFVGLLIGLIILVVCILCIAAALYVHLIQWKTYHYICPSCATPFKPDFMGSLTAMNYVNQRKIRCSKCGSYQLMTPIKDKDAPGRQIYRR